MAESVTASLSELRSWVAMGREGTRAKRLHLWMTGIEPSLSKLKRLFEESKQQDASAQMLILTELLARPKSVQWGIEDVARTPGNELGKALHVNEVRSLRGSVMQASMDLTSLEIVRAKGARAEVLAAAAGVHNPLSLTENHLLEFLEHGVRFERILADLHMRAAENAMEVLLGMSSCLSDDQQDQVAKMQLELRGYVSPGRRAMDLREQPNWNVADYLLKTQAEVLEIKIQAITHSLSESQVALMKANTKRARWIGNLTLGLAVLMILCMGAASFFLSRINAARIVGPLAALVKATQRLSLNKFDDKELPVQAEDEVGVLTKSFNSMRASILESRQAAHREAWLQGLEVEFALAVEGNLDLKTVSLRAWSF